MNKDVQKIIDSAFAHRISFTAAGVTINKASFTKVSKALEAGKIKVEYYSRLWPGEAHYVYSNKEGKYANKILVGTKAISTNSDEHAQLLHECVHAACDIQKPVHNMLQTEAVAYIAQVLYDYFRHEAMVERGATNHFGRRGLLKAVWGVVKPYRKTKHFSLKDKQLKPIFDALMEFPYYRKHKDLRIDYDGV